MAEKKEEVTCLEQGSSPNEAIFFVLAYLPVFELLAMAQVCKSLRDAITNDILPWLKIVVERPLNWLLTDDILLTEVASKAKGRLQVLALINCTKITDDGLLRVIAQNPHIIKLHVPGCTGLSPEGVITAVKLLSNNLHTLNSLRISGIYGIETEHLQTLRNLRPNDNQTENKISREKIYYHELNKLSALKINCTIDVHICPKCSEIRTVFDCPQIPCGKKQLSECRGCDMCITRCIECGICLAASEEELEEACCSDTLCLKCWLKLPKCNFCNKPYCNRHTDKQRRISGSTGFVCENCHSKFG